nr:MAG TPA: hypothetical protein [Bacteriophage sp.]
MGRAKTIYSFVHNTPPLNGDCNTKIIKIHFYDLLY